MIICETFVLSGNHPHIKWLEYAKLKGYKWADKAIEYNDINHRPGYPNSKDIKSALNYSFNWSETIEGHDYWDKIYKFLKYTNG